MGGSMTAANAYGANWLMCGGDEMGCNGDGAAMRRSASKWAGKCAWGVSGAGWCNASASSRVQGAGGGNTAMQRAAMRDGDGGVRISAKYGGWQMQ